jgi:hypothetical protein
MYRFLSYLVTQSLLRHILALPRPPSGRLPLTSKIWGLGEHSGPLPIHTILFPIRPQLELAPQPPRFEFDLGLQYQTTTNRNLDTLPSSSSTCLPFGQSRSYHLICYNLRRPRGTITSHLGSILETLRI